MKVSGWRFNIERITISSNDSQKREFACIELEKYQVQKSDDTAENANPGGLSHSGSNPNNCDWQAKEAYADRST